MEASSIPSHLPPLPPSKIEKLKRNLVKKGVSPTPKILHNLRKKQTQKHKRSLSKQSTINDPLPEETYFKTIKSEFNNFNKELSKTNVTINKLVGNPWNRLQKLNMLELMNVEENYGNGKLSLEPLKELSHIIESDRDKFTWLLLDDDVEFQENWLEDDSGNKNWTPSKRRSEGEAIKFLIQKLSGTKLSVTDWRFSRMMKRSALQFTEKQMLRIVEGLGEKGQSEHAKSIVDFVFNSKEHRHFKSRYVYTKLLAVLGKARKPHEALEVFHQMRRDFYIYPDMAAYHSVAVTLGQAGLLKELVNVIDCMKEKPHKLRDVRRKNWDPVLQPDIVIFNAVLNACVPNSQWKGVSWVFEQLRKSGLRPNGATYGLAMEVMLESRKYDLVHYYFERMKRSGETLKAITYRVLVKTLWKEGKVCEAVTAVRDMEQRGVVGNSSVYYELACCLCYHGRWQDGFLEIDKIKTLHQTKPLQVTFTGMILSSLDGGNVDDCSTIFKTSKHYCTPDIGMVNAMLKAYGQNDMFLEARELFEDVKGDVIGSTSYRSDKSKPDAYTFQSMLQTSVAAHQWEYFEYVYKEMALFGYQLDSNKYALLLVKSSRAGKWWLLEHAFDTILEAGEIPHMSFFVEILCQAVIRRAFAKAITISNTMAYAPFQVSELQWTKIFYENKDRISKDSLVDLLDALRNNNALTEGTVKNLLAALQSFCGHMEVKDSPCSTTTLRTKSSSGVLAVDFIEESDVDAVENINSTTLATHILNPSRSIDVEDDDSDWEMVSEISDTTYYCTKGRRNVNNAFEHSNDGLISYDTDFCHDNNQGEDEPFDLDELGLGVLGSEDEALNSGLPTASEILETWKKLRKQDTFCYPFSEGQINHKLSLRDC
ncbi:hypothetical protein Leryth_026000 [Lithospermum erythrorhizon]|nr:hypothetical protein Leryth_026000 [Lithospermum erythrorhizon]